MLKEKESQPALSKLNEVYVLIIIKVLKYMYKEIKGAWSLKCHFSTLPRLTTSTVNVFNKRNFFFVFKFQFISDVGKDYLVEFIAWSSNNYFLMFLTYSAFEARTELSLPL